MPPETLVNYLVTATVLTIVPGLDTAMVLRSATNDGARHGVATAVGIGIGCLCWGGAASIGLAAILEGSPAVFDALKWGGALYLCWLGAQLLFRPRHVQGLDVMQHGHDGLVMAVRRGFTTNILNPKVGLFYLTLLPQFVPQHTRGGGTAFTLAVIHVGIALAWFAILSTLAGGIRPWLHRPGVMRGLDRLTGGIFVLLGYELTQVAGLHA